jgi:hypothetical protein
MRFIPLHKLILKYVLPPTIVIISSTGCGSALHRAVNTNDFSKVNMLLETGVDPN